MLIKLCKKSCLHLCTQLSAAFFTLQRLLGRLFQTLLTHTVRPMWSCVQGLWTWQLRDDSRQAFLTCKEWQQPFGMNLWHSMPCCVLVFVALLSDWLEKSCFIHLTKLSVLAGTKQVGLTASSTCSHISTCSKADSVRREKQVSLCSLNYCREHGGWWSSSKGMSKSILLCFQLLCEQ